MWWEKTVMILSAVGAINWGLNELNFNLIDTIFNTLGSKVLMVVYYLIALCGVYALVKIFK